MFKKIIAFSIAILLSVSAMAAEKKITVILGGSAGGTLNSFSEELVKDLAQAGYEVDAQPGESMVKGGQIYSSLEGRNAFLFVPSAQINAEDALVKRDPTVSPVKTENMAFAIVNYKVLCAKSGTDLERVFNSGNSLKIGMNEGEKINNKYVDRLNKVTKSKNIMVPYNSSGKQITGLVTEDIDITLVNEAKALRHSKEGQVTCNYTTNPNGGNGFDSLSSRIGDNWFGWSYEYLLVGHIKSDNAEFTKEFHKAVTAIINDPNSNSGKKIAKNGWFALDLSQKDLTKRYNSVFTSTQKLLK